MFKLFNFFFVSNLIVMLYVQLYVVRMVNDYYLGICFVFGDDNVDEVIIVGFEVCYCVV